MNTSAQTQCKKWIVTNQLIDFNTSPTTSSALLTGNNVASYNAMQDANGNLLFYVFDGLISNSHGILIDRIINNNLGTVVQGYPETCIVPVPGSCSQYYVIAADYNITSGTRPGDGPIPFYVTVDMSLPNQSLIPGEVGALVGANSNPLNAGANYDSHSNVMSLAVSKLSPSNERFLFVSDNSSMFRFTITATGISNGTWLGNLFYGYNGRPMKLEMELYQDGFNNMKLATIELNGGGHPFIVIYNLNSSGNITGSTNRQISNSGVPNGLEFSPNGQFVYVTNTVTPFIQYFDVALTSNNLLPQIPNQSIFSATEIELGSDGDLYFGSIGGLSSLSNSNNPTAATWNSLIFPFNFPTNSRYGIRVLQDQIDGEVYGGIADHSSQCCDFSASWNQLDLIASLGSSIWTPTNNPINGSTGVIATIKGTLTIPSGADITISGMIVSFGLFGKITILPGGKLTINGTTLTGNSTCQNMWLGVEVLGSGQNGLPNTNQQGQFISTNSIIEEAEHGIENGSFSLNSLDYGGYFIASNSTFRNCWNSILMYSHNRNAQYASSIVECTFIDLGNLWYPHQTTRTNVHVGLFDVRGGSTPIPGVDISFSNSLIHNTFNNADYGLSCLDDQNIIIQNASFQNCGIGISDARAFSSASNGSAFSNLTFANCYTSIAMKNTNGDEISNNVFNSTHGSQNLNFYGVNSEGSNNFHVTDNSFYRLRYGVFVNNSGSIGGRISSNNGNGNIFHECWRGIDCRGDNSNLQIKCNQFWNITQPVNEFSTAWFIGGDMPDQGDGLTNSGPAGNEFYRAGGRKDIYSLAGVPSFSTYNFIYYKYYLPFSCTPLVYTPNFVSVSLTTYPLGATSCSGQGLMAESGNDPENAKTIINQEPDLMKKQLWVNELIAWYQAQQMDADAKAYLENRFDDAAKQMLFPMYIANNEYEKANEIINYYCANEDEESRSYCNLNSIILNWANEGRTPFEMTESERTIINEIANNYTGSTGQAQSLLKMVYNEEVNPWQPSDSSDARFAGALEETFFENPIEIFPNPVCKGSFKLISTFENSIGCEATISLFDLEGKLNYETHSTFNDENATQVNIGDLANGIYMVKVEVANLSPLFKKLVVNK